MFNDVANKINGDIFAIEPLHRGAPEQQRTAVNEYSLGIDVWHVDENSRDSWIANGQNDTIPNLHKLIYQRSSIHNSAVNMIANLIYGAGWEVNELETYFKKNADGFFELEKNTESFEQLEGRFKVFDKNVLWSKALKKISHQLPLYGGYYKLNTYNLNERADSFLRRTWVEDYENMRIGSARTFNDGDFISKSHYLSDDFNKADPYNVVSYQDYVGGNRTSVYGGNLVRLKAENGIPDGKKRGIFSKFVGNITPYRPYYGTPHYESLDALSYMDIDYMIGRRDWKDLEGGFSLDCIIVRYRSPKATQTEEQEQRKKDRDFMKRNLRGYNGENTMLTWANPYVDESGVVQTPKPFEIIEIPHNTDSGRFQMLREERVMKILNAHNITSGEIIGLPNLSRTGLSSQSEYLIVALEQLYFNTIKPLQEIIINDFQEEVIANQLPVKLGIKKSTANFKVLTENILQFAYGKDEIRKKFGDNEMTEEVAQEVMNNINQKENNGLSDVRNNVLPNRR